MNAPWLNDGDVTVHAGDCTEVMETLDEASIDVVITDPPYGLEFMGREWDRFGASAFQAWSLGWGRAAFRAIKPGGHLLAFGGTRTFHRLTCGLEDAGFEIRDVLTWLYGSGFPKSLDVSKAIDKAAGAEREPGRTLVTDGTRGATPNSPGNATCADCGRPARGVNYCTCPRDGGPVTDAAREWEGWGTALKPAWEPIILARKPLAGTVARNVQEHGTGALNIDACRIDGPGAAAGRTRHGGGIPGNGSSYELPDYQAPMPAGRWPANVALDEDAAALLDTEVGDLGPAGTAVRRNRKPGTMTAWMGTRASPTGDDVTYGDSGGPSRFFYTGKASTADRNNGHGPANTHPTVKPTDLMRWLVRLATPPGGIILDPFAGSGTTGVAARAEGHRAVLIERDPEYLQIIAGRLSQQSLFATGG